MRPEIKDTIQQEIDKAFAGFYNNLPDMLHKHLEQITLAMMGFKKDSFNGLTHIDGSKGSMVHSALRVAVLKYFEYDVQPIIAEAVNSESFKKVVKKLVRSELKKQLFEIIKSRATSEVRTTMKAEVDRLIGSIQRDFTEGLKSSCFMFPVEDPSSAVRVHGRNLAVDTNHVPNSDFIASQENFGTFIGSVFLSQIAETTVNEAIEKASQDPF
jgi:hypothetical protein